MTEFVVDACVLRSAGFGTNPTSIGSRNFISLIYTGRYQAFLSGALEAEWTRHASKLALAWIASMETQGLLLRAEPSQPFVLEIDRQIESLNASYVRCAKKDSHLVTSALSFHALVVSHEVRSRNVFCRLALSFDALHEVRWVSPQLIIQHGILSGGLREYPVTWTLSHA